MKILIVSLAGIGDTLLATPLIRGLRRGFPDAQIDVLAMWGGARQILEGNPLVNTIHQKNFIQEGRLATLRYLLQLRREHYDVSLNIHPQGKRVYRVVAWLIHARRRFTHTYENKNFLDGLLATDSIPQDYSIHTIDNNLNFLPLLGLPAPKDLEMELYLSPAEKDWAQNFVRANALEGKQVLGVHVGSGKTKNLMFKRWPVDNYAAVLKQTLARFPNLIALLFGGPEEKSENETLLKSVNNPRLLPVPSRTTKEAAAVLGHCAAFLSVDNLFMHLAAAMKVPRQIIIESPTFNETIFPYHRPFQLVRNPMVDGKSLDYYRYDGRDIAGGEEHLRACMRSITPEMVVSVIEKQLEASS
jgi:ADP-heptose:LPS heptosyltransferase